MDNHQAPERNDDVNLPSPTPEQPIDDSQLTPRAWLMRNGIWLLVIAAVAIFFFRQFGVKAVGNGVLLAVGLGLVIFIHELGHFLVAKWCDVHVETFSIGFGPALPGCSFRWVETTYKVAMIPLGGYVKMIGEAAEEGDDDNPRSFKNKSVGQRMAIISAGVIMNILLACVCFIVIYHHGRDRQPAVVGAVAAGGPAWQNGIRSGATFTQIDQKEAKPGQPLYFETLTDAVVLSFKGQKVHLGYEYWPEPYHEGEKPQHYEVDVEPRVEKGVGRPQVGLAWADSVQFITSKLADLVGKPYTPDSAAAAARKAFHLEPGDAIVGVREQPGADKTRFLPRPVFLDSARSQEQDGFALAGLFQEFEGKKLVLYVWRGLFPVEVETEPAEFQYGDIIMGTTDPEQPNQVKLLPPDPRQPESELRDIFDLYRRLRLMAGQFVVFRIRHTDGSESDLVVPPAYHRTFGMRMKAGTVVALRNGSTAREAGVQEGDILRAIELLPANDPQKGRVFHLTGDDAGDPVELPFLLQKEVAGNSYKARLTVERDGKTLTLKEVAWDNSWRFDRTLSLGRAAPLAINELGVAYSVDTTIDRVVAADSQLKAGDVIKKIRFHTYEKKDGETKESSWMELESNGWAGVFSYNMQLYPLRAVDFKVERGGETLDITVKPQLDPSWPLEERGFRLMRDVRVQKETGILDAIGMGVQDTIQTIRKIYSTMLSLAAGRVSFVDNIGGPITIATTGYAVAGVDFWEFMFFMSMISINLAVVNFLPIPVLDGGHMVFLIYEGLRGRPAPDAVKIGATYVGLALLLALMGFVMYVDISRLL